MKNTLFFLLYGMLICFHLGFAKVMAAETDSSRTVYVKTYNTWTTNTVKDNFDDTEIRWFTFAEQGKHGNLRLSCSKEDKQLSLLAHADNELTKALGDIEESDKPIETRIKIDKKDIIVAQGKYPYTLSIVPEMTRHIIAEMRSGSRIRIRTLHGKQEHTFRAKLKGFTAASNWVAKKCGVSTPR